MIWKCRPDTQFEEEEKNKKPYMSWMSDQFVHNRAGEGCGLDTNRPSGQLRCKIISGTVRCESNKLHMDLLWPNSSHFHRRAGTKEFDRKKNSPQIQQDKKQSVKRLSKDIKREFLEENWTGNRHGEDTKRVCWRRSGPGFGDPSEETWFKGYVFS